MKGEGSMSQRRFGDFGQTDFEQNRDQGEFMEVFGLQVPRKYVKWAYVALGFIFLLSFGNQLVLHNEDGYFQVRQDFIDGEIHTQFTPAWYPRWFAHKWDYKIAKSYKYTDKKGEENISGPPIQVRFNGGGKGKVFGDVRFQLPASNDYMTRIQIDFGSDDALMDELYEKIVKEAVITTAALLSAEESYTLRSQFSFWVEDQIENGIYIITSKTDTLDIDAKTGEIITRTYSEIAVDTTGGGERFIRKERVLANYGITVEQCVIEDVVFLDNLGELIDQKRQHISNVATVRSAIERAEQEVKTATLTGKKEVQVARYETLETKERVVSKARNEKKKALIDANKLLQVSIEDLAAASDLEQQLINEGKGEAEKRKKTLQASGAIAKKKEYFERVVARYNRALRKRALSSEISSGGNGEQSQSLPEALALLNQIKTQLEREMGVSLTFRGRSGS